jgi:3-hydroxy-9,10-secoandrosta-1,3,5(10)-triene-9,17-dione monooxygenase reductase component
MIHDNNPFLGSDFNQTRRFRARLARAVTIVTAGVGSSATGLTVSSLLIIEGEPSIAHVVVGPNTDLWETIAESGRFVIHVARSPHRHLSDDFAGMRPAPGGPFAGVAWSDSEWGPILTDLPDRAFCSMTSMDEEGWSGLVTAVVDQLEITDLSDPLIHFRGTYRGVEPG